MFKITSPEAGFTGFIGPVQFVQGKATTDHPSVVAYCRRHGYTVEPVKEEAPQEEESAKPARARKGGGSGGD